MRIRSSMVQRLVPIAIGVGAILAGSTGLAHAAVPAAYPPADVSAPGPCALSTHGQTGNCVNVDTLAIRTSPNSEIAMYFECPLEYPYPFEGALSGNPTWLDRSFGGYATVMAVAPNGEAGQEDVLKKPLSYAGDAARPGYVTVLAAPTLSANGFAAGRYQCSDTPATPR